MNVSPSNVAKGRTDHSSWTVAIAVAAALLASIQPVSITTITGRSSVGNGS
jgi:hypothetical protein